MAEDPSILNKKIDDLTATVNRLSQQFADYIQSRWEAGEVSVFKYLFITTAPYLNGHR